MSEKVVHSDPAIMHGTPVFVGTRVPAETLWQYLEAGDRLDDFLMDFPSVTKEQAVRLLQQAREKLRATSRAERWRRSIGRRGGRRKEDKTMRYVSLIHRDEAGYGVSFPDFPGCVSVGDTVDDAVRGGSEALAFHVEGLIDDGGTIPAPRSIDAIKADPELAEWRHGADFVLIPLLLDRGSSKRGADVVVYR